MNFGIPLSLFLLSLTFLTPYAMILLLDTPGRGSYGAAKKQCATPKRSLIRFTLPLSLWPTRMLCASKPCTGKDQIRKEMTG